MGKIKIKNIPYYVVLSKQNYLKNQIFTKIMLVKQTHRGFFNIKTKYNFLQNENNNDVKEDLTL